MILRDDRMMRLMLMMATLRFLLVILPEGGMGFVILPMNNVYSDYSNIRSKIRSKSALHDTPLDFMDAKGLSNMMISVKQDFSSTVKVSGLNITEGDGQSNAQKLKLDPDTIQINGDLSKTSKDNEQGGSVASYNLNEARVGNRNKANRGHRGNRGNKENNLVEIIPSSTQSKRSRHVHISEIDGDKSQTPFHVRIRLKRRNIDVSLGSFDKHRQVEQSAETATLNSTLSMMHQNDLKRIEIEKKTVRVRQQMMTSRFQSESKLRKREIAAETEALEQLRKRKEAELLTKHKKAVNDRQKMLISIFKSESELREHEAKRLDLKQKEKVLQIERKAVMVREKMMIARFNVENKLRQLINTTKTKALNLLQQNQTESIREGTTNIPKSFDSSALDSNASSLSTFEKWRKIALKARKATIIEDFLRSLYNRNVKQDGPNMWPVERNYAKHIQSEVRVGARRANAVAVRERMRNARLQYERKQHASQSIDSTYHQKEIVDSCSEEDPIDVNKEEIVLKSIETIKEGMILAENSMRSAQAYREDALAKYREKSRAPDAWSVGKNYTKHLEVEQRIGNRKSDAVAVRQRMKNARLQYESKKKLLE